MGVWLQMGGEAPLRGFTLDVSTPDWPDPGMVFRSVDPGPAYPRRGPAGYDDRDFARFDLVGPTPMPHSDSLFQCSARIRRPRAAAGSAPALGGGRCGRDSPWKVAVGLSSAHRHFPCPTRPGRTMMAGWQTVFPVTAGLRGDAAGGAILKRGQNRGRIRYAIVFQRLLQVSRANLWRMRGMPMHHQGQANSEATATQR